MGSLNKRPFFQPPFHYGWVIVISGLLSIFACLGFARFVLGMILPSMSTNLQLRYSDMGLLGTGNFLGYLIAVLLAGRFIESVGARIAIFTGLTVSWISMMLIGFSDSLGKIVLLYGITGVGSGITNISIMGLVSKWFTRQKRGTASGIIVIGSGFALIISGLLVPFINGLYPQDGWRVNWWISATIVFLVSVWDLLLIRNKPEELNLRPVGQPDPETDRLLDIKSTIYTRGLTFHLGIIYLLFGLSYVIYITFVITSFVKEYGLNEAVAGQLWSLIGLLSLLSGPVFGGLSDRLGRGKGLMIVFAMQMIAYALSATGIKGLPLYMSIFFFGVTVWSIPSIMAAAAGDYFGPLKAPSVFGFMTFVFSIGQITGPVVAGLIAEATGSLSLVFTISSVSAGIGLFLSSMLKRPEHYAR